MEAGVNRFIKIALIDGHKLFRDGMKRIINPEPNIQVIADGCNGKEAIKIVRKYEPDVVLMDIILHELDGIEVTKTILEEYPNVKVIFLSVHDDENYVISALQAGAQGYLLKKIDIDSLFEAIKVVADGGFYLHSAVTNIFVKEYRRLVEQNRYIYSTIEHHLPLHLLTCRECLVLQSLSEGQNNSMISETLMISENTVKNHVSNILQKLKVNDRTHAASVAIKNGWVQVLKERIG